MHYVYILKSLLHKDLYVGSTNDLKTRFRQHNAGKSKYTLEHKPWQLLYYEAYSFENLARSREQKLKQHGNALRALKKRIGA